MTKRNKTLDIEYKFFSNNQFSSIHKANLKAFSDYAIPVQMNEKQFENHIVQNGVDLELSVGAFYKGKIVGFTLNGVGEWENKKTVYDAGTGVIPEFRRKGIGENIFRFLLPKLKEKGFEQMLLEVLRVNNKAMALYKKLGFKKNRELMFFKQQKKIKKRAKMDLYSKKLVRWNGKYSKILG